MSAQMTQAGAVPAGALVFLECGCMAYRQRSPEEGPIMLVIHRPCLAHRDNGLHVRYVEPSTDLRPFVQTVS